ncbi:MAG TPA: hypothetical protein VHA56_05525 [Mucilaginibacter sp.]|nr:hypothetical protein [Mucilaginibacter sp.]
MKCKFRYDKAFSFFTILLLSGCGHIKNKTTSVESLNRKLVTTVKTGKVVGSDTVSLRLDTMLHDVLQYARKHSDRKFYRKHLNLWDFQYQSDAYLEFGKLFSSNKSLIVKSDLWGQTVALDVFLLTDSSFKAIYHEDFEMSFIKYIIKDVNGDGAKDFLVDIYPASGCCLRNVFFVCLQSRGTLLPPVKLINPTFSPSEKLVRGIGYGQPGEVDLYKCKWDGFRLDTIEIISPDKLKHQYHVYYSERERDYPEAGRYINRIPRDYQDIAGYDWFMGY